MYPNIMFGLELTGSHGNIVKTFSSGHPACSNVTLKDTKCTLSLPRDEYNITLTLMNDHGARVESGVYDSKLQITLVWNNIINFHNSTEYSVRECNVRRWKAIECDTNSQQ